jgi:heat shock protein HslJ
VLLRDLVCTGVGPLPRPVTVIVEEGGQMSEGCAGDPLALLSGGDWLVHDAGGTEIAPALGVTMLFGEGRISGGSGCNRYSGGLVLRDAGLSVAGIAMTRRACAPDRMQIESLFLQQLARAVAFTISDDGRLHLTDSSGTVLISAQR